MNNNERKKYYQNLKAKIASDGKSHSSIITKEGIVIDGILYIPSNIISSDNSQKSIEPSLPEGYTINEFEEIIREQGKSKR